MVRPDVRLVDESFLDQKDAMGCPILAGFFTFSDGFTCYAGEVKGRTILCSIKDRSREFYSPYRRRLIEEAWERNRGRRKDDANC